MTEYQMQSAADAAWHALLQCRHFLAELPDEEFHSAVCSFGWDEASQSWSFYPFRRTSGDSWSIICALNPETNGGVALSLDSQVLEVNAAFPEGGTQFWLGERWDQVPLHIRDQVQAFRLYLPVLIGGLKAKRSGQCFAVGHLAQTLDGRIASHLGNSRWISNEANLIHSHRLRALCDGVAVGWRTAVADNCSLTVRHVKGANPTRVILDPKGKIAEDVAGLDIFSEDSPTIVLVENEKVQQRLEKILPIGSDVFAVSFVPSEMLSFLGSIGIHSLLVEGGGRTISAMLATLPLLHLHFAPRILGSGVASFTLPPVDTISEGFQFHMEHFIFDREILFECSHQK
jgi:5-amino-6-(5-phosphoribosylamino)uracil reductase/diaminohydroxyphosphoribosylaminopyrimidine deaminase/5-amino-6-(5-phosphoribosylamino)uracil reductase